MGITVAFYVIWFDPAGPGAEPGVVAREAARPTAPPNPPPPPRTAQSPPAAAPAPRVAAAPVKPAEPPDADTGTSVLSAAWQRHAVPAAEGQGRPAIAIVIDDMGVDRRRSAQVVALPGPLTLAWLPYANDVRAQATAARMAGHELLVHMPMEPSGVADPGPGAMLTGLPPEELRRRLEVGLSAIDDYVGINNHMGSRFTEDREAMALVLEEVGRRGLLFLDSRTSGRSVGHALAREMRLPAAVRDVFIDHDMSPAAVRASLGKLEQVARRQGFAIGIGHPHDVTIQALAEWLPGLEMRGFTRIPVSAVVQVYRSDGT
ncbi:MAG TPA: divergent polysaccharide deacetylase family protein [Arenibaculum sp.]|nr:divergent polysaccharide deacetylase family protein [Arenibaculum sp.]